MGSGSHDGNVSRPKRPHNSTGGVQAAALGGMESAASPRSLRRWSTERRLRKMSQEFLPARYAFSATARVLCVGSAVVYRVEFEISNMCSLAATPGVAPPPLVQTWVTAMNLSKVRTFYDQVGAILQQSCVAEYLSAQEDDEWKPFETFLQLLMHIFDRYQRLEVAFKWQVDEAAMQDGKTTLESFLSECWSALEVILPALAVESHLPEPLRREILCIYLLMRDFLALPESILEANCVYASAVLSLEDVEDLRRTPHAEYTCSICLEKLVSLDMRDLADPANGDGDSKYSVKLPCLHQFHENCIMAWLRHNPTCPECRASVGLKI